MHRRLCRDLAAPARRTASGLPEHVATVKRPDGGKLQLTYDGHPLYRYAGDQSKADAKGEGVGGQWYVVKAGAAAGPNVELLSLRLNNSTLEDATSAYAPAGGGH